MDLQESLDILSGTLSKTEAQVKGGQSQIRTAHDGLTESRKLFQVQAQAVVPASAAVSARLLQGQTMAEQAMHTLQGELSSLETGIAQRIASSRQRIAEMAEMVRSLTSLLTRVEGSLRQQQRTSEAALLQAGQESQEAFRQSRTALTSLDEFVTSEFLPKLRNYQQNNQAALSALTQKVRETFVPAVDEQIRELQTALARAVDLLQQETQKAATQLQSSQSEAAATTAQVCNDQVVRLHGATADSARSLAGSVAQVEEKMREQADSNRSILETYNQRVQQDAKEQITIPITLKQVLDKANIR